MNRQLYLIGVLAAAIVGVAACPGGSHCGETKYRIGSWKLDQEDNDLWRRAIDQVANRRQSQRGVEWVETSKSDETRRKVWAIGQCLGDKDDDNRCSSCIQHAAHVLKNDKKPDTDWAELHLEGCSVSYCFWDTTAIDKKPTDKSDPDMGWIQLFSNVHKLPRNMYDIAEGAMSKLANDPPKEGSYTFVSYEGPDGKPFNAVTRCSVKAESDDHYDQVCGKCIKNLADNALYRVGFSQGIRWQVKDCYLRYEIYELKDENLGEEFVPT